MSQEKLKKMRSKIMIIAVVTTGLLLVGANPAMAQETEVMVAKGGVGESGPSGLSHHEVTGQQDIVMVLRNTTTSLCPNTGVIAVLVVNGEPVKHGNITKDGSSIQVNAKPGDNVIAIVHTVPLFNDIACIRLGELDVVLYQRDMDSNVK